MSEYQYYEFRAIDRHLDVKDRAALRAISSRADISSARFTNHYEWGDFKGDPSVLMERYFDLHLYLANWGSRHLSLRFPKGLVDEARLPGIAGNEECLRLRHHKEHLIVDIARDELDVDDATDGSEWLDRLETLRADVIAGDYRLFYLLWLMAVQDGAIGDEESEPLAGIGPLTPPLRAFAEFFAMDLDLVEAAAEREVEAARAEPAPAALEAAIRSLSEGERVRWLSRLLAGEAHLSTELRARLTESRRAKVERRPSNPRSVGELRARAETVGHQRERRASEKALAARKQQLAPIEARGEKAWQDVEAAIVLRQPKSYDRAVDLIIGLRDIAGLRGQMKDFEAKLNAIMARHSAKRQFLVRLEQSLAGNRRW